MFVPNYSEYQIEIRNITDELDKLNKLMKDKLNNHSNSDINDYKDIEEKINIGIDTDGNET